MLLEGVPDRFVRPVEPVGHEAGHVGGANPMPGKPSRVFDDLVAFLVGKLAEPAAALDFVGVVANEPTDGRF